MNTRGINPDGLILGKAMGGGVYPVSAFVGSADVIGVFTPGSHGFIFGGDPLGGCYCNQDYRDNKKGNLPQRSKTSAANTYLLG